MRKLCGLALTLGVVVMWTSVITVTAEEKGFQPLFNGEDMSAFVTVGGNAKTWTVEDGVIKCTGRPNGYFRTKKSYEDYILKFDFRYPERAGNSGYLIHITGEDRVWPKCVEVQGHYNGVCSIFPIGGAKGERPKVNNKLRSKVRKPHKEWNSIEIISKDGNLTAKLNGNVISKSSKTLQRPGRANRLSVGRRADRLQRSPHQSIEITTLN